ncbi:MAG TPA: molybdate ABC transporter substrate-binding protein [Candidatus Polarisedimenticolaceae bacterium]|nr:molybdate ABC transporter substrate-binding protein [Candidatus Polarisedimenticolaceae bacterium]
MNLKLAAALVAAAISLKAPLEESAKQFVASAPGEEITFNFGSSGQLAAQIEQGAPADLFIAASPVEVERLRAAGKIDPATRGAIAGNRLVVITHEGGPKINSLADLAKPMYAKIAIGNPKTVPAGRYADESLTAAGIADKVKDRLVFAENVRQVVDLVTRNEADAGLVYATDVALGAGAVKLVFEVPDKLHGPLVYEGAVVKDAPGAARAKAFLDWLKSKAGRDVLTKSGFTAPPK